MVFESDKTWLDARIAATEALIVAHEAAITALTTGGAQSYSLDTGQTRTSVTRANLSELRIALSQLENRRSELRTRRYGAGHNARPGFP